MDIFAEYRCKDGFCDSHILSGYKVLIMLMVSDVEGKLCSRWPWLGGKTLVYYKQIRGFRVGRSAFVTKDRRTYQSFGSRDCGRPGLEGKHGFDLSPPPVPGMQRYRTTGLPVELRADIALELEVVEVQVLALAGPVAGASVAAAAAAEFVGTESWVAAAQWGMGCAGHTSLTGLGDGYSRDLETLDSLWRPMSNCWGCFGESHATALPFAVEEFDRSVSEVGLYSVSQHQDCFAPECSTKSVLEGSALCGSFGCDGPAALGLMH